MSVSIACVDSAATSYFGISPRQRRKASVRARSWGMRMRFMPVCSLVAILVLVSCLFREILSTRDRSGKVIL